MTVVRCFNAESDGNDPLDLDKTLSFTRVFWASNRSSRTRLRSKKAVTFDCSPDYNVKITGRVVDQAQLGPDRISTKFKKK